MVHFDDTEQRRKLEAAVRGIGEEIETADRVDPELHEAFKRWALDFKARRWSKLKALDVETQIVVVPYMQILTSRKAFETLGPRAQQYFTDLLAEVGLRPPAPAGSDGTHRALWRKR